MFQKRIRWYLSLIQSPPYRTWISSKFKPEFSCPKLLTMVSVRSSSTTFSQNRAFVFSILSYAQKTLPFDVWLSLVHQKRVKAHLAQLWTFLFKVHLRQPLRRSFTNGSMKRRMSTCSITPMIHSPHQMGLTGIAWHNQWVNSTQYQPGRHFIIIEGHRLFESEAIMKLPHQVVFLTGTHYTLRNRKIPTPETSFKLYCDRIRPLLPELNASKNILKLDARNSPESMVKKVGAFLAMSNLGYQHCGKRMSDTKILLELSENN